jgi:hypothetical protein
LCLDIFKYSISVISRGTEGGAVTFGGRRWEERDRKEGERMEFVLL